MLHLRILVAGAVHVSVVVRASRDPSGDPIEADVVRAALGPINSRLEDLRVPERGSISFFELGESRSQAA